MIGGCIEISGPRMRAWVQIPLLTATFYILFVAFSGTSPELNSFQSVEEGAGYQNLLSASVSSFDAVIR